MEVYLSKSDLYEQAITTDYATAHLLYELHKDTATLIHHNIGGKTEYYDIAWRKGR